MECSCSIDIDSCEDIAIFQRTTSPKAHKKHVCFECKRTISIGEEYERSEGLWDGSFNTYKTCSDCLSLRSKFFSTGWYHGSLWDDFYEYVNSCEGDIPENCLLELTPIAKGKACDIMEDCFEYND